MSEKTFRNLHLISHGKVEPNIYRPPLIHVEIVARLVLTPEEYKKVKEKKSLFIAIPED